MRFYFYFSSVLSSIVQIIEETTFRLKNIPLLWNVIKFFWVMTILYSIWEFFFVWNRLCNRSYKRLLHQLESVIYLEKRWNPFTHELMQIDIRNWNAISKNHLTSFLKFSQKSAQIRKASLLAFRSVSLFALLVRWLSLIKFFVADARKPIRKFKKFYCF